MTFERVLALAILTIAGISLVLGNDIVLGNRLPNDHVIRNVSINLPPTKHGLKLIIPIIDRHNVSSINVTDRNVSNNQSASIIFGGIGHRLAVLYLTSPSHQSLNFTILAHGVRPQPPPPPPPSSKPVSLHQWPPSSHHERPAPPPSAHRPQSPPYSEDQYDDIYEFDDLFF